MPRRRADPEARRPLRPAGQTTNGALGRVVADLHAELQRRERRLDGVVEVLQAVLGGADTVAVLGVVARSALHLLGAKRASVITPEPEGEGLRIAVAEGAAGDSELSTVTDAAAEVMRHGTPVSAGPSALVPMSVRGTAVGVLVVADRVGGRRFDGEDVRLLQSFADQVSLLLGLAEAQREPRRLAVLATQERIAGDLQFGLVRELFALGLSLQGTALASSEAVVAERLQRDVAEIDRIIADLRGYVFGLRPGGPPPASS